MEQPASHARGELGRKPLPVRYACGLLRLQAVLWAVAAVGFAGLWIAGMAMSWTPPAWAHSRLIWFAVEGICVIVAGGLSGGSALLRTGLRRGEVQARIAAIVLESLMVPFGWLFATYTATGEGFMNPGPPAGLVGGALSMAAAIALLGRRARSFTKPVSKS